MCRRLGLDEEEPAPMDDRDLMGIRADTDFTYDARGRMLRSNEPCEEARRPAPRLFLGRTMAGYVVRVGATAPDDLARRLEAIIDRQPSVGDLHAPPAALTMVREALARHARITAAGAGLLPGQRRAAGGRDVGVAAARGGVGGVGVAALGGGGGSPRDDERRGGGRGRVLDAHLHGDGARRAVAGLGLRLRGARRLPRLGLRPTTATLTGVRPAGLCWRGGARWSRAMLWRGYRHARGGPVFHPGRAETRGAWPETEDWLHQMDALLGATETMDAA